MTTYQIIETWDVTRVLNDNIITISSSNISRTGTTWYAQGSPLIGFNIPSSGIQGKIESTSGVLWALNSIYGATKLYVVPYVIPATNDIVQFCIRITNNILLGQTPLTLTVYDVFNIGNLNIDLAYGEIHYFYGNYTWGDNGAGYTLNHSATACCLHENTLVDTSEGPKPINKIKSGDKVIKHTGELLEVVYNIKYTIPATKFIKINKESFGKNMPLNDIFITEHHPLVINGEEIECQKLVNGDTVTNVEIDETIVYSICCSERTSIMIEGVPILTWEQHEWEKEYKEHKILWSKANDSDTIMF